MELLSGRAPPAGDHVAPGKTVAEAARVLEVI